jgi:DNA-binding NarL/FixJ family response regulator
MPETITVAILEDHQSTIDGYQFRLSENSKIKVVASRLFSQDLIKMLETDPVDVLILDINVPISQENRNIQPIHKLIGEISNRFADLKILVITMYNQRAMIKTIMGIGTSGYILKDDFDSIRKLGHIVEIVANGGIYMSERVRDKFINGNDTDTNLTQRELEVLSMCSAYPDDNTGEIATKMGIANSTVRNFLHKIYIKLQVHGRTAAILKARQIGLLPGIEELPKTGNSLV